MNDDANQLTNAAASLPDGTPWSGYQFSYAYDATGNPVEQNKNGLIYSNSFNNLNQNAETRFAGGLAALGTYSSPLAATVTVNNIQAQLHDGDWAATGIPFVQGTNALARTIQDLAGRSSAVTSTVVVADRTYAYDANGNMTVNGVFTYVWDCENRLTEVWKNGTLVQRNRYDALWRRREKIEYAPDGTAVTNRYIYKDWLVLAITDASGALLETYTHGADLSGEVGGDAGGIGGILASSQAGSMAIYHCDFNGNIVDVSNCTQTRQADYTYSPFGEILSKTGSFISRYRFSSKEWESAIELTYYGTRYYAPKLTCWMSRDPIGELGGINIYSFCNGTSVNGIDPIGANSHESDDSDWEVPYTGTVSWGAEMMMRTSVVRNTYVRAVGDLKNVSNPGILRNELRTKYRGKTPQPIRGYLEYKYPRDSRGTPSKAHYHPTKTNAKVTSWGKAFGRIGAGLTAISVGCEVYSIANADPCERGEAIAGAAGRISGGIGGGEVGAEVGAVIGSWVCPGPGTVIGGLAGGLIGSLVVGWVGGELAIEVYDALES